MSQRSFDVVLSVLHGTLLLMVVSTRPKSAPGDEGKLGGLSKHGAQTGHKQACLALSSGFQKSSGIKRGPESSEPIDFHNGCFSDILGGGWLVSVFVPESFDHDCRHGVTAFSPGPLCVPLKRD
ncbi:hypothetical protein ElyMa_006058700 [Elysia marginata]|uniref:Fibrinogen C-terminal domain-containing protein n=1 Tax=Elysia marginata TaxID=1093978 RepID=A0AAV4GN28_9GAST|nr:hypothetical protein ElyMa_006058700 [Elysia marginata]